MVQQLFQLSLPTGLIDTAVSGFTKISRRVLDASTRNTKKLKRFLRLAGFRFQIIQNEFRDTVSSVWRINRCCLSADGIGDLYENWNQIGELLQADFYGSAIYIGRSIYYFGYESNAIQRLDFTETEELQNVAQIGNQQGNYNYPVLFQTGSNYCI
ncbi:unnamed protein product [Oikopleura dioica]|uniref:Uncharacterized protein n=1 Tax=Oikopleura dioica TaxID=34765 RepID=E4Z424_OIKDI|nr:unnamed protein product [Oikopleura dioica]